MKFRICMAAMGLTLLSFGLRAQDSKAVEPNAAKVEELMSALGSAEFEKRDDAAVQLVRIGRPALEALKKLAACADPEVQNRARQITKAIHKNLREHALSISVMPDKAVHSAGEEVKLEVKITNKEDFPVTVALCQEVVVTGYATIDVQFEGKSIQVIDKLHMPKQVCAGFGSEKIPASLFHPLQPGESVTLYTSAFTDRWVRMPRLISDKGEAAKLSVGAYKIKTRYEFSFDLSGLDNGNYTYEGDSRSSLEQAWQGILQAETEFRIDAAAASK